MLEDNPFIGVRTWTIFSSRAIRVFGSRSGHHPGTNYLAAVVEAIFPKEISPAFVWSRDRCVQRYDPESLENYFAKDLKKVRRVGISLDRVLIVEDTPQKVERNYGNAIYVSAFHGDPGDCELPKLCKYLRTLANVPNVRSIEKRGWSTRM